MHGVARFAALLLVAAVISSIGLAQSTVNPDISVIPRFLIESNDGEKLSQGKREFSQPDFQFQELELVIQSYLNPFSRADVVLTLPGPDIEANSLGIEELYATVFRGLPLDLNVRFGKYRVEYGKINMIHPHVWPFVTQPLSQARFLGEEGLNDLGISASVLLPTGDVYSKLTVDLLRGAAIPEAAGMEDTTGGKPFYATSARLMGFFTLTDESDLEVGLSGLTGVHDPYHRDRFWYLNADVKYKYKPSSYTSLVLQGEYLYNTRSAAQDQGFVPFLNAAGSQETRRIQSSGLYIYVDYQFLKLFSIGARYDWSQAPYSNDDKATGVSVFAGYYPVEETLGLRLEYQHLKMDVPGASTAVNTVVLQLLFSLGPHKAHPF